MNNNDEERVVLRVSGSDSHNFLQNLVTNDINKLDNGIVYSALLTPQGKYLFDFFLIPDAGNILIDVKSIFASNLLNRLSLYRLRANIELEETQIKVSRGVGEALPNAFLDPRHPKLGWRLYSDDSLALPKIDWERHRVEHCIPETGIELIENKTFILEAGFERLNGVDFHKGCFVGQEVTARMKHKTTLRRELKSVLIEGAAGVGSSIKDNGRTVGTLYSQSHGKALAMLRMDWIKNNKIAVGDSTITII